MQTTGNKLIYYEVTNQQLLWKKNNSYIQCILHYAQKYCPPKALCNLLKLLALLWDICVWTLLFMPAQDAQVTMPSITQEATLCHT